MGRWKFVIIFLLCYTIQTSFGWHHHESDPIPIPPPFHRDIVRRALNQFLNEEINQRLQSAISREEVAEESVEVEEPDESIEEEDVESRIVTTEEELEGLKCIRLFRPQFRKVKIRFASEIP